MMQSRFEPGAGKLDDFAWIYALYELGQTAATGVDPLKAQQDILDHIVSGLDAESGSIALVVEGTEDLLEIAAILPTQFRANARRSLAPKMLDPDLLR